MKLLLLLNIVIAVLSAWASVKNLRFLRLKTKLMEWGEQHSYLQKSLVLGNGDYLSTIHEEKLRLYDIAVVIQWLLLLIFIASIICLFVITRELRQRRFSR